MISLAYCVFQTCENHFTVCRGQTFHFLVGLIPLGGVTVNMQFLKDSSNEKMLPEVENSHRMLCGEPPGKVCSLPAGVAACWHSAPAVAAGLWCYRRKISAALFLSPAALMYC